MGDTVNSDPQHQLARINQVVSERQETFIQLLRSLVQTTPDGEEAVQQLVRSRLEALGCDVTLLLHHPQQLPPHLEFAPANVDQTETRTSLVGHYRGTGDGRSLLLFAHPDSEPVHGLDRWEHDPFAAEIVADRMIGWGVADDLQGVAAMIAGLDAALAAGLSIRGDLLLASTPSKRDAMGILAVLDQEGIKADGALYLHPAESGEGLGDIKSATAGLLRFHLTVTGAAPPTMEPTHTPFYHLAVDPLEKAWSITRALRRLDQERGQRVRHAGMEAAVGRATNLQIAYLQYGQPDKLSRVATQAVLAGTVTFPPDEPVSAVKEELLDAIGRVVAEDAWLAAHPPLVEWLLGTTGVEVGVDTPLYQTVHRAIARVTGIEPQGHSLHSASDIRLPMLHSGIPTVGFGSKAGDLTQAGGHDEWIDIPDYLNMIRAVAAIIGDWS
jgi:acetylornithine deacetylase